MAAAAQPAPTIPTVIGLASSFLTPSSLDSNASRARSEGLNLGPAEDEPDTIHLAQLVELSHYHRNILRNWEMA